MTQQQVATIKGISHHVFFTASRNSRICDEWDFEKNVGVSHENIDPTSKEVVNWRCTEHGHKWTESICDRFNNWTLCPVCKGKQLLVGFNDLGSKLHKDILDEWHPTKNFGVTPQDIIWSERTFVYWQCLEHGHEWKQQANTRVWWDEGCIVCAGKKVLTGFNDIASLPEYADAVAEWHPTKNGKRTPDKTVCGYTGKLWFQCLKNSSHEWSSILKHRIDGGSGCLECAAESNLEEVFQEIFNETGLIFSPARIPVQIREPKVYGLASGYRTEPVEIEVDGYNKDLKLVIMFDDEFSHGLKSTQRRNVALLTYDIHETADLLNDGYKVIRIRESAREGKLKALGSQYLSKNRLVKNPCSLNNYFSITYKSFDENSNIKDLVDTILKRQRKLFTLPF